MPNFSPVSRKGKLRIICSESTQRPSHAKDTRFVLCYSTNFKFSYILTFFLSSRNSRLVQTRIPISHGSAQSMMKISKRKSTITVINCSKPTLKLMPSLILSHTYLKFGYLRFVFYIVFAYVSCLSKCLISFLSRQSLRPSVAFVELT